MKSVQPSCCFVESPFLMPIQTSSHTLCFAFSLLALYPEEQDKLYQHIMSICPDRPPVSKRFASVAVRSISYNDTIPDIRRHTFPHSFTGVSNDSWHLATLYQTPISQCHLRDTSSLTTGEPRAFQVFSLFHGVTAQLAVVLKFFIYRLSACQKGLRKIRRLSSETNRGSQRSYQSLKIRP